MPPSAASCPGNDIFLFFLVIYLHICTKTGPLDASRVDSRGRRTARTPSARHCECVCWWACVRLLEVPTLEMHGLQYEPMAVYSVSSW